MRRRNVVHLRRLRCLQSAWLGGTDPPPSLPQSCSDRCKMSCFLTLRSWKDARGSSAGRGGQKRLIVRRRQKWLLSSPPRHTGSQGQGPPPGETHLARLRLWISKQSYFTDILKKQITTLILWVHENPVTLSSIIMELCWSHVFPARSTIMKAKKQPSIKH